MDDPSAAAQHLPYLNRGGHPCHEIGTNGLSLRSRGSARRARGSFLKIDVRGLKMAKDKEVVVDEVWTEARIREFLDAKPVVGIDGDFHALQKAYHQMRADDFEKFVGFFLEKNRNINARDPQGRTLLSYIVEHTKSAEYAEILRRHGAA
jgi:hypothetical protein